MITLVPVTDITDFDWDLFWSGAYPDMPDIWPASADTEQKRKDLYHQSFVNAIADSRWTVFVLEFEGNPQMVVAYVENEPGIWTAMRGLNIPDGGASKSYIYDRHDEHTAVQYAHLEALGAQEIRIAYVPGSSMETAGLNWRQGQGRNHIPSQVQALGLNMITSWTKQGGLE